jgi:carboxypeptidase T
VRATRAQMLMAIAALALCGLALLVPVLFADHATQAQPGWQIVRITFRNRADLAQLAARLDIWETYPEANLAIARVSPAEQDWLASQGYPVSIDTLRSQQAAAPADYECYRTVNQLYADENALASAYPALTQIITIGASYEDRPLRILRLTNQNHAVPDKPRLFLIANVHGREFITPEAAMQFAARLLNGHGHDADATWLLDWHEIHVLVSANPDGHARNEDSYIYWRKNTRQNGCPTTYGTDLNRNFGFQWGGAGSSSDTCSEIYHGPSAASDLETQAIQNYAVSLFPDQRGALITDAAPVTTSGVLISLHSYQNLVLWPWGFADTPSPNDSQLEQFGRKLAGYNGYTPQAAHALYPTSGTTDDWSYGTLGIASYTFEMGTGADGFLPSCIHYSAIISPNLDALWYAARVARAPYQLSAGPDVLTPTITFDGAISHTVQLTATIVATAGQVISAAQVYADTPPWSGGAPLTAQATDGAFDNSVEVITTTFSMSGYGRHLIFVRGQDAAGNWGPVSAAFLDVLWLYNYYFPMAARQ